VNANVHPVFQPLLDTVAGKRESPALRFIRDEGDVDLVAVLAEYTRRLDAYPARNASDIACNLNYEVCDEQVRWAMRSKSGLSVVSAKDARELSSDGRLA
jgi:hypothetical protein